MGLLRHSMANSEGLQGMPTGLTRATDYPSQGPRTSLNIEYLGFPSQES